jgi:DnaJ like chaperone protein
MGWLGKIVGGTLGFALGGPLGAIAGAALGHTFDATDNQHPRARLSYHEEAQMTFFVATFSMLAKVAQADGRISPEEIQAVEDFMANELNLTPESKRFAVEIFETAINSPMAFQDFAGQFYHQFHNQPRLLDLMIDVLLRLSVADGALSDSEEKLISSAARTFRFSEQKYNELKARYAPDFEKYYAILGIHSRASDDEIKRQYRKLVKEYHPDKIASKGLPEEFNKFANDKFREIQDAYDTIRQQRDIQ